MRILQDVDEHRISTLVERGEFFWLDLAGPPVGEVERLAALFDLHPLAVEDTVRFGQRAKVDDYDTYVLLVYYAVADDGDGPVPIEVHLFVSGQWIITVHRGECRVLTTVRDRLAEQPPSEEQFIVYRLLDALTDSFFPVLDELDDQIEALEDDLLGNADQDHLQRIVGLRRRVGRLYRAATAQRDLFDAAVNVLVDLPGLTPGPRNYFRDVADHLNRICDRLGMHRELMVGAADVHLSTTSNRLNETMAKLTAIATVFLPLTFITGFFGQNFGWLVDHIRSLAAFLGFGLGLLVASIVGLSVWFRGRRLL